MRAALTELLCALGVLAFCVVIPLAIFVVGTSPSRMGGAA